jgi:hypothetical protein
MHSDAQRLGTQEVLRAAPAPFQRDAGPCRALGLKRVIRPERYLEQRG